jgi:hypothetical protein
MIGIGDRQSRKENLVSLIFICPDEHELCAKQMNIRKAVVDSKEL